MNKIQKYIPLVVPYIIGFICLYVLPFFRSIYYSFLDNIFSNKYVGLTNYSALFGNYYFRLGIKNTILFSIIGVTLLISVAFLIAVMCDRAEDENKLFSMAVLLPFFVPSTALISIWKKMFENNAFRNWMNISDNEMWKNHWLIFPILLLFLWKHIGLFFIIFKNAVGRLPVELEDACRMDGGKWWNYYFQCVLPCILPEIFFATIFGFSNSMRIYRESALYYGTSYPKEAVYSLSYFMQAHFRNMDYELLTAATVIMVLFMSALIGLFYHFENRYTDMM